MASIALIGPGAIGATVAVRLERTARHCITVCARSPVDHLAVETTEGHMAMTPNVLVSPAQGRPCDWVLVATKAYDVASAAAWLPSLMGPQTRLAVLQNGVEHMARFAPYVAQERIVPVVVNLPVERIGPGHFRQRRSGQLTVAADVNGHAFVELFANSGIEASAASDFQSELWRKLAVNCAGAVSALVLKPAAIAHQPQIAEIMKAMVRECIAVARAEGADLDDALADQVLDSYRDGPGDAINSLHADRLAGRPIEIDARNGAVVRLGRRHGIATPVNAMIVTLLEAAASTADTPSTPA